MISNKINGNCYALFFRSFVASTLVVLLFLSACIMAAPTCMVAPPPPIENAQASFSLNTEVQGSPKVIITDLNPSNGLSWEYEFRDGGTVLQITVSGDPAVFSEEAELATISVSNGTNNSEQNTLVTTPGGGTMVIVIADL